MRLIKTGLAAFGMSGQIFHAPFIHLHPQFELTAIVERSKELSKERYPYATIVRSFDDLLKVDGLELVVVNTPDRTHYEYAYKALLAGKHVIVEKPFVETEEQGNNLLSLAREKGLMLAVFQNRRWDSDFLTVKKILNEGVLGRLVEFESTFPRYRKLIKEGTWKETGEMGGGLTYNLGAHLIDQAVQLFGVPHALFADIDILRDNGMVDDYFNIHFIMPYRTNIKVTLKSSYLMCQHEPRFVLHGTEGSFVKYGLDRQEADLNAGLTPDQPDWGVEDPETWGTLTTEKDGVIQSVKYPSEKGNYMGFYDNIFRHLRYGEPLATDVISVLPVIRIIQQAYFSSERKIVVPFR